MSEEAMQEIWARTGANHNHRAHGLQL